LMMAVTSFMKLSPELVDLPQENKPDSSLSAVPGFVTHRRPKLPDRCQLTDPDETPRSACCTAFVTATASVHGSSAS